MDLDFGFERLNTETTFVKDEKLNQHHERFEQSVVSKVVLNGKNPLDDGYSMYKVQIERGRLPGGSQVFQSVLGELVKGKTVEFTIDRKSANKSRPESKHSSDTFTDESC